MQEQDRYVARQAGPLWAGAVFLEVIAIIGGVIGAISGIAIAATHSHATAGTTTPPYVAEGISVVVVAIVWAVFFWCVARALKLFAVHVAVEHGDDLSLGRPGGRTDGFLERVARTAGRSAAPSGTKRSSVMLESARRYDWDTEVPESPGWYRGAKSSRARYFDGQQWTDRYEWADE